MCTQKICVLYKTQYKLINDLLSHVVLWAVKSIFRDTYFQLVNTSCSADVKHSFVKAGNQDVHVALMQPSGDL